MLILMLMLILTLYTDNHNLILTLTNTATYPQLYSEKKSSARVYRARLNDILLNFKDSRLN